MKRLVLFLILALCASAALAFDPNVAPGDRIAILRTIEREETLRTLRVTLLVRGFLVRELRSEGFDAVDSRLTYDDLLRGADENADYYVEVADGFTTDDHYGGAVVGGRHAGVGLGVVVSHLSAVIRIYDGRTLELVDGFDVYAKDRGVMPTAIGVGSRNLGWWVGIPITRILRARGAAREAARDAARSIAGILESEALER